MGCCSHCPGAVPPPSGAGLCLDVAQCLLGGSRTHSVIRFLSDVIKVLETLNCFEVQDTEDRSYLDSSECLLRCSPV